MSLPRCGVRGRILFYIALPVVLFAGAVIIAPLDLRGTREAHTLVEAVSTVLALIAGTMALVRYYTKKTEAYLFLGAAFLGAALLDAVHVAFSTSFLAGHRHWVTTRAAAWSGISSRAFLSTFVLWTALKGRQQAEAVNRMTELRLYLLVSGWTLGSLLFFSLVPLPPPHLPYLPLHRPVDLIPGIVFSLAAAACLRIGSWKSSAFAHYLILSLIVAGSGHLAYMAFSVHSFDPLYMGGHVLKIASYCLVLTGLFLNTITIFRREAAAVTGLANANESLAAEIAEREHAQESLRRAHDELEEKVRERTADLVKARAVEQERSAILEMVSMHVPLSHILNRVLKLISNSIPGAGTAVWTGDHEELRFLMCVDLPEAFAQKLQRTNYTIAAPQPTSRKVSDADRRTAAEFGLLPMGQIPLSNAAGRAIGLLEVFVPVTSSHGSLSGVVTQMANLAAIAVENRALYERLAFQAQHDTLTELPNRLLFQDRVQQAIRLARRQHTHLAVIWIDLDRFKQVNDGLGHRAGDELLCEVARRLSACLRESDTVARVGGDEFVLLANALTSAADVDVFLPKVLDSISQPMIINKHEVAITASAGVSMFPDHGDDPGALMRHADLAMYSAKRAGRNEYHLFSHGLGDSMNRRLEIETQLKHALERKELSLEYQPLVASGGRLDGLEALLRWNNTVLGEVPPAEFIPIAEEMGLMRALGEWVIRAACRDGANWIGVGFDVPRIAVNVSALQFAEKSFVSTIEQALRDSRFPPALLEIEVTETVLIHNVDQVISQIESLRHLGVKFAIDDFGTGYSSLSQLQHLPVDSVKIDRSFIKDLGLSDGGCTTLVRGIVALAHNLHLRVVAEGVETEEQLALLTNLGCDVSQGFWLYRPMAPRAVEDILSRSTKQSVVDSPEVVACASRSELLD